MSGFPSQTGQVGIRTQASQGTYADPGAVSPNQGEFLRITGGNIAPVRQLLIPDAEIGGNRDMPDALLGAVSYAGTYDFYARLEAVALLVKAAFGSVSSTSTGTSTALVGTHVITPSDASIPWVSVEEAISSFDVFRYTDAKVNTFHLEAAADGYVKGSTGLIALGQTAGNAKTSAPKWDTTPLLVGTNCTVTFAGVDLKGKSMKLDFTNNIENNDYRMGSLFLGDAVPKRRDLTGEVTIRPESNTLWRQAVYGSGSATAPIGGAALKGALNILINSYTVIGTSATVYSINVAVPSAAIKPFDLKPQGDNVIETQLMIQALRPDPTVPLATVTIVNGLAALN